MFEFVFELIDLFFTFYPKSIDIKIVLWNTFENVLLRNQRHLHEEAYTLFFSVLRCCFTALIFSLLNPLDWN